MTIRRIDSRDEFALLPERAVRWGIPPHKTPTVSRRFMTIEAGAVISAVQWTAQLPEVVLLHRRGRDARSLDRIALALGVPALAVDLPEHSSARLISAAIAALAPQATTIITLDSHALRSLDSPKLRTIVLIDTVPEILTEGRNAIWHALSRTASSYLLRSRHSPVTPSDVDRLRRRAPRTRLLQLAVDAADIEDTGADPLITALRAILPAH
jgi:hypothetical protein